MHAKCIIKEKILKKIWGRGTVPPQTLSRWGADTPPKSPSVPTAPPYSHLRRSTPAGQFSQIEPCLRYCKCCVPNATDFHKIKLNFLSLNLL